MSSHFPKIDQKEYLKKYLSGDKVKKKKKAKKHQKSSRDSVKVKIIDDDINNLNTGLQIDEELLLTGDDAPQIVGEYIEENRSVQTVPKWKSIVIKDEPEDEKLNAKQNETDLWGRKSGVIKVKQENNSKRTSDQSPPRRKDRKRNESYSSPPRRNRSSPPPIKSERDKSSSIYSTKRSPDGIPKIKTEPNSPPYKQNRIRDSYDISPPRRKTNSQQSPSRRGRSPSRTKRQKSQDQSPPRRRNISDQSPPRRVKSLNRKSRSYSPSTTRRKKYSDKSPPRKRRDSDRSPPRKYKGSDQSPVRQRRDSDQSPPRKSYNKQRRQTPDNSPPRKHRKTHDQAPSRGWRNLNQSSRDSRKSPSNYSDYFSDQSPSRRKRQSLIESCKKSPLNDTRRGKRTPDLSPQPRRSRWEREEKSLSPPPTHKSKPEKTLEGKKAGLQDAAALKKETMERRKQEDTLLERMSADISGRNAEVQVRSTGRKGRRAREALEEDPIERRRKEEHEEKKKLLYDRWGKGLKQIEDHENRMVEQKYEGSKPLARYSNDEDLERHLKEQERSEDPMLEYMRKKRKEKEKQSGKPQIPRYEGPFPENRFGIRPGYRWDGVDRSNGYENKYFAAQNEKLARQDEAYKYSVEDM